MRCTYCRWATHQCQDDKCQLAYSKVQVECDVCRSCSIQALPLLRHALAGFQLTCEIVRTCAAVRLCIVARLAVREVEQWKQENQLDLPKHTHGMQEAGCEVHDAGSLPFDCNAALNNFFRAAWLETSWLFTVVAAALDSPRFHHHELEKFLRF